MGIKFNPFTGSFDQVGATEQDLQDAVQAVEGTASVVTTASATLPADSTGPVAVSLADAEFLAVETSIKGLLGTVYGTLSRAAGGSYSFTSDQSYSSTVNFASGTRFATAALPSTFNPLRVGDVELRDGPGYGEAWPVAVVDDNGKPAYAVDREGTFYVNEIKRLDGQPVRTTDTVPEGSVNLYFTEQRVLDSLPDTDQISEGSSNLYFTEQRAVEALDGAEIAPASINLDGHTSDEEQQWGSHWLYGMLDQSNRPAFAIDKEGGFYTNNLKLFDGAALADQGFGDSWGWALLDKNNKAALAVDRGGNVYVNSISNFDGSPVVEVPEIPDSPEVPSTTDDLAEGAANLYFTNTRARAAVSADTTKGLAYDAATGKFSSPDGHANRIIVKWGDSISTDISIDAVLAQLEPGRQMLSRSTGGIDNGSILARFDALPITGRVYWEVKTVTVASYTGNVVTLTAGGATGIEVGDYFNGSAQHDDTVITAVDTVNDQITLCIDAGLINTGAGAYAIQRPKIEGGKQISINHLLPTTVHDQTRLSDLSHFFVKGLKGVPYPSLTNLPRSFNTSDSAAASDWSTAIAELTADGYISTAPEVVVDTTVTSGGTAAGQTSIVLADASKVAPGHFIMAKGIPYGCRVWSVDYDTNTVKLAMDTDGAISGNVRIYRRTILKPDTTADIAGVGEVQLKHCINIFDFDPGNIPERFRPHWWPNVHHGPERFDYDRADFIAQCKAFVDTQNNPYGKYLITSYQIWGGVYEADGEWIARRNRALWAAEAFPENFYDLARDVWLKAESWYQANYLTLYQANWEKTFIQMGSGAIAGAPTSGTYGGGEPLMDGDLWLDGSTTYILLLTTGDATHDAAQQSMFGGTHTLPTTAGQGVWITLGSYTALAGAGVIYGGLASGRSGVVDGVTYQGSAYDIARKSSPRIGKRDAAHSNAYGSRLLGYLIGQELLRRGW